MIPDRKKDTPLPEGVSVQSRKGVHVDATDDRNWHNAPGEWSLEEVQRQNLHYGYKKFRLYAPAPLKPKAFRELEAWINKR